MDIVYIRGLQIATVIGIFDFEREHRQPVVLDLELAVDSRPSAAADEIGLTVSYKDVTERLIEFVENSDFKLVEALAEECAALVMTEFSVPWLRLQLGKPQALGRVADVGIIIERGSRPGHAGRG